MMNDELVLYANVCVQVHIYHPKNAKNQLCYLCISEKYSTFATSFPK